MFWYLVICVLMLYPASIVHAGRISGKKTQHVALAAACLILFFFMAMRDISVGVDTQYYCYVFTQFPDIPLSQVFTAETFATDSESWTLDFEYGYRLLNKLVSYISQDPQAITIVNSLVIMILLYNLVKRQSPNVMLSIWLYITLGVFQTEMNVTRNAIAILTVYLGLQFVERKQPVQYVLCCLVAASFHKAALVFIPLYWLFQAVRWDGKKIVVWILGALAISFVIPLVLPALTAVLPYSITKYFYSSNSKAESLLVGIFYLAVFFVVWFFMNRQERKRIFEQCHIGTTMFVLNLVCFALSFGFGYAARLAALFGPYMILYVPQMLETVESQSKKRMIAVLVAGLCGIQYILRLCINNIGGTMPYAFFW